MYNGNTVKEKEIRENYNKIFEIIGDKEGLRNLTYETYLGLRDDDTRKKAFNRRLSDAIKNRNDDEINTCLDTINSDVAREDRIDDKSEDFFKLGEKIYPKEEEKQDTPPVNSSDSKSTGNEEAQEEKEKKTEEKTDKQNEGEIIEQVVDKKEPSKIGKFLKDVGLAIGNVLLNVVRWSSLGFGGLMLVSNLLAPGGIGISALVFSVPLLVGASTFVIPYIIKNRKMIKLKLRKIKAKLFKNKNKDKEKGNDRTNSVTPILDFTKDLDEIPEEIKITESSQPSVEEMKTPSLDFEKDIDEDTEETKTTESSQPPVEEMKTPSLDFEKDIDEDPEETKTTESSQPPVEEMKTPSLDFEQDIDETLEDATSVENTILKINSEIEDKEKFINSSKRNLEDIEKEIETNKHEKSKAGYVAKLKQDYERVDNERKKALEEIKRLQDNAHSLNESLKNLKNKQPTKIVQTETSHKIGDTTIKNKDKKIIVTDKNEVDVSKTKEALEFLSSLETADYIAPRIRETIDYTDTFENRHKR